MNNFVSNLLRIFKTDGRADYPRTRCSIFLKRKKNYCLFYIEYYVISTDLNVLLDIIPSQGHLRVILNLDICTLSTLTVKQLFERNLTPSGVKNCNLSHNIFYSSNFTPYSIPHTN